MYVNPKNPIPKGTFMFFFSLILVGNFQQVSDFQFVYQPALNQKWKENLDYWQYCQTNFRNKIGRGNIIRV